jgi:hypothetical protein
MRKDVLKKRDSFNTCGTTESKILINIYGLIDKLNCYTFYGSAIEFNSMIS